MEQEQDLRTLQLISISGYLLLTLFALYTYMEQEQDLRTLQLISISGYLPLTLFALCQHFELQGRRFTNFHYYYYLCIWAQTCCKLPLTTNPFVSITEKYNYQNIL